MKLLSVLLLCVAVATATNVQLQNEQVKIVAAAAEEFFNVQLQKEEVVVFSAAEADFAQEQVEDRSSFLINALVRQLLAFLRLLINQSYDPVEINRYELSIPAGLVNMKLILEDVFATGFGGFVVHRSDLDLRSNPMTFDVDVSIPQLNARAGAYDLSGDLFTAIPLYGKGHATFDIRDVRFQGKVVLKQSDDGKAILIERIDDVSYEVPHFKTDMSGVIGGGNIDQIVNAVVEEVIIGYVNRFENVLAPFVGKAITEALNPIMEQLDTWKFISPFV